MWNELIVWHKQMVGPYGEPKHVSFLPLRGSKDETHYLAFVNEVISNYISPFTKLYTIKKYIKVC